LETVEILNISKFGIWTLVNQHEYFMPYSEYPWFQKATVSQIYNVQLQHGKFLRWPDLDVDLELAVLVDPSKYPLNYK
jgi:hypothetical protein